MSKIYEQWDDLNWLAEMCCDECNDVVHNHFDCPVCISENAGTDVYDDIYEYDEFCCQECKAEFVRVVSDTEELWKLKE